MAHLNTHWYNFVQRHGKLIDHQYCALTWINKNKSEGAWVNLWPLKCVCTLINSDKGL